MSGHSHWAGIKHKKEASDQKRGRVFSKLLAAITVAARSEPNPDFNPRLRTAIEKAKENKVPNENIERAIKHASEVGANLEELILEAYGPGGVAILIKALTDNRNRLIAEIKKILNENYGKWAESGNVRWVFESLIEEKSWRAKFSQQISEEEKIKLAVLIGALEEYNDVQKVYTNAA
jgi:YebC/PmpR family DNA-binding regulatory protein